MGQVWGEYSTPTAKEMMMERRKGNKKRSCRPHISRNAQGLELDITSPHFVTCPAEILS